MIWCKSSTGGNWGTAGNLAGDFTHGVGVAHAFYDSQKRQEVPSGACRFQTFDRKGVLLEELAIVRYKSRWQDDRSYGNGNQDLMMFELEKRPARVDRFLSVATYHGSENQEILLVTFHSDVEPAFTKRKTWGRLYSNTGTRYEGDSNLFVTDVDGAPMASGGAIYDSRGVLVGVFRGSTSSGMGPPKAFDRFREFNYGLRFDARFVREFAVFLKARR